MHATQELSFSSSKSWLHFLSIWHTILQNVALIYCNIDTNLMFGHSLVLCSTDHAFPKYTIHWFLNKLLSILTLRNWRDKIFRFSRMLILLISVQTPLRGTVTFWHLRLNKTEEIKGQGMQMKPRYQSSPMTRTEMMRVFKETL